MRYSPVQGSADSVPVSFLPSFAIPRVSACPTFLVPAHLRSVFSVPSALLFFLHLTRSQQLAASWFLLPLFFALPSFVFSNLQSLFAKQGRWGGPQWLSRARFTPCPPYPPYCGKISSRRNHGRPS